jgi:hypothetical protein
VKTIHIKYYKIRAGMGLAIYLALSTTEVHHMTHATESTIKGLMLDLSQYQKAKVYYVAQRSECPIWVAYDILVSEEWDCDDAIKDIRNM